MPSQRSGLPICSVLLLLVAAVALSGCATLASRLSTGLRPTAPAHDTPSETPIAGPSPVPPSAPDVNHPEMGEIPSETGLLFIQDGRVMQGDALGKDAHEIVTFHRLTAWGLARSQLALLQGELLYLVDLRRPVLRSVRVGTGAPIAEATVVWGIHGESVLHIAVIEPEQQGNPTRRAEFRVVDVRSGTVGEPLALADVTGVTVLRYDDKANEVMLIPRSGDHAFSQVDVLNLTDGTMIASLPIRGEGLALLSPNGSRMLTRRQGASGTGLSVYHLVGQSWRAPQAWEAPAGTVPVSCAWSPDGDRIACLLAPRQAAGDPDAAGIWLLSTENMAATRIAGADGIAQVIGWLPGDERIVLRRSADATGVGYTAMRVDGTGQEPLGPSASALLLGWAIPAATAGSIRMASEPGDGWWAAYYDNIALSGDPTLVRRETSLSLDWDDPALEPVVGGNGFSARWIGAVRLAKAGTYAFTARGCDGLRVWMDGRLVIDAWEEGGLLPHIGELALAAGIHDVHIEFYHAQGAPVLDFYWASMAEAVVVDDLSPRFELGGDPAAFCGRDEGYAGHLYWTWNSRSEWVNWARWYPGLEQAGLYDVQVHIAERYHNATRATYTVFHNGTTAEVTVDQNASRGRWISLGTYRFAGGDDEYVELTDATGEDYATRLVGFDAIRLIPLESMSASDS